MEKTEKLFMNNLDEAEHIIEERKDSDEGVLIDWKISVKETKEFVYYIVTLKTRYYTLTEAKEKL